MLNNDLKLLALYEDLKKKISEVTKMAGPQGEKGHLMNCICVYVHWGLTAISMHHLLGGNCSDADTKGS